MQKGQKKTELILYVVLWTILFAVPVLGMYVGDIFSPSSVEVFSSEAWKGVLYAWRVLLVFFITFAIHNFFIAPLIVYRNCKWLYGIWVVVLFICFTTYQMLGRPHRPEPGEESERRPDMERTLCESTSRISSTCSISQKFRKTV